MKPKKAAGPDGIKSELYKALMRDKVTLEALNKCMKETIEEREIPQGWKTSRTAMIPKKVKPKANEIRPIALNNISYKLTMAIMRINIEEQIKRNNWEEDEQVGFTEGGRVENNLLILRYCIERTYKMKKKKRLLYQLILPRHMIV